MIMRLPDWLKNRKGCISDAHRIKKDLRSKKLHSVCEEAKCPNLCECFSRGTSTFMILGNVCTRNCRFCAVKHGRPEKPDPNEPINIAQSVEKLKLKHVVITSVTRDDLDDKGAEQFARCIKEIRRISNATIEILTPDFNGEHKLIDVVLEERPDVFNHNVETIFRLTKQIRDKKADFNCSLNVLSYAKSLNKAKKIKSGFMVGLGEAKEEVFELISILKNTGVNIITIGQYLSPNKESLKVERFVHPDEFAEYKSFGQQNDVLVFAGPLVRSSYNALEVLNLEKNMETI